MIARTRIRSTLLAGAGALLLALAVPASATGTTGSEDVSREVTEAMDAIARYGADQRDQAKEKASEAIAALDRRLETLEHDLEARLESMDAAARRRAREEMARLRKQRNELSEWFGGIQHSSADAWEHVKEGFGKSAKALSDSLREAGQSF